MSPAQVDALAADMCQADLHDMQRAAEDLAQRAAWLTGYFDYRSSMGVGDSGHDFAVDRADYRRKKVRKALGFSYP